MLLTVGMVSSGAPCLLDMNIDIMIEICRYLKTGHVCSLVQTCRAMRDNLYNPSIWKNSVFNCSVTCEETAHSLIQRGIKTISLCKTTTQEKLIGTLQFCALVVSLEELIVDSDALLSLSEAPKPLPSMNNIKCIIVHVFETDMTMLKNLTKGLRVVLHSTKSLVKLRVRQLETSILLDIYSMVTECLPLLRDFEHGYFLRCNMIWLRSTLDMITSEHSQNGVIKRFCGVQTSMVQLSEKLPCLQHLRLLNFRRDRFNREGCHVTSVLSLSVICDWPQLSLTQTSLLLNSFPNLSALEFDCQVNLYDECVDNIIETCPYLRALIIQAFGNGLTESACSAIISGLHDLEVLVLPTHSQSSRMELSEGNWDTVVNSSSKLTSLLGLKIEVERLEMLPDMRYISSHNNDCKVLKIQRYHSAPSLAKVDRQFSYIMLTPNSADYYEAVGSRFFHPESAIKKPQNQRCGNVYRHIREHR